MSDHQIVPITREEFMAQAPFSREDSFCKAYFSKADMQGLWPETFGIRVDGKLAACITTTQSKREPKVANLQLLHTFSKFRKRGLARILCTWALQREHDRGSRYMRVSAEPEAVAFYEKLGYKFLGRQKSGCQLSMFRMPSGRIEDAVYDRTDPVIASAISSKRKGGVVEDFGKVPSSAPASNPCKELPIAPNVVVGATNVGPLLEFCLRRLIREELQLILGTPPQPPRREAVRPASTLEAPPAPAPPPATSPPPAAARQSKQAKEKPPRPDPVPFLNPDRLARLEEFRAREKPWPRAINLRGTNGSGKTHLVRALLDSYASKGCVQRVEAEDGYLITRTGKRDIFVVGSYETACGGCDAICGQGALDKIYGIVEEQVTKSNRHVLFEGIIVCSDFRRSSDLVSKGFPLEILMLSTPLEKCVANINSRRSLRGNGPLENTGNVVAKFEGCERSIPRFEAAKVPVRKVSQDEAARIIEEAFAT